MFEDYSEHLAETRASPATIRGYPCVIVNRNVDHRANLIVDQPFFCGAASGGDLPLTTLFEPVGLAVEQQDVGMVCEPVQQRGR